MSETNLTHTQVLIIGAGPAGLACAINLKKQNPGLAVVIIDKGSTPGAHNLSGAVVDKGPLEAILDLAKPDWRESDKAKTILGSKVQVDDVIFAAGSKHFIKMNPFIKAAAALKLGIGKMLHSGDYIVSISRLCAWLAELASDMGIEVLHGFTADHLEIQPDGHAVIKLLDQGKAKDGSPQPNYLPGETIHADIVVLAEGADGLVTEKFIISQGLKRKRSQLYSIGIKELIQVTPDQYNNFGPGRVIHAMGYPLWTPLIGPAMFGGSIMYAYEDNCLALGVIIGLDFKYKDFNPQQALELFKKHSRVAPFIANGKSVATGAKMIPEAGYDAIPRDPATNAIGKNNVLILGDSAGFVNMQQIKGLHNAIDSGILAANAITENFARPADIAALYTEYFESSRLGEELRSARNFRQTIAKFGPSIGFPLSIAAGLLPRFDIKPDYLHMTSASYKYKPTRDFDKASFTANAHVHHREDQPCHLIIEDSALCEECKIKFGQPCITFCPAGVYESIDSKAQAANPSNCLHCKTCQRKCPYDNIRWTAPEPTGGPAYKNM